MPPLPEPGHHGHLLLAIRDWLFPAFAVTTVLGFVGLSGASIVNAVAEAVPWHWAISTSAMAAPFLTYWAVTAGSIIAHKTKCACANTLPQKSSTNLI